MGAYHGITIHFPLALWVTAFLGIAIRAFFTGSLARNIDAVLTPLLFLGALSGVVAYLTGLLVWPWDALSSSPAGRNHFLVAGWTLAYWILLWVVRWRLGSAVWDPPVRWLMPVLALLGAVLLAITGTIGGNLAGNPSALPVLLRRLGWDVDTTFYLPDVMLLVVVLVGVILIVLGALARKQT